MNKISAPRGGPTTRIVPSTPPMAESKFRFAPSATSQNTLPTMTYGAHTDMPFNSSPSPLQTRLLILDSHPLRPTALSTLSALHIHVRLGKQRNPSHNISLNIDLLELRRWGTGVSFTGCKRWMWTEVRQFRGRLWCPNILEASYRASPASHG